MKSVGLDPSGTVCLWAMVETDGKVHNTEVRVFGTGHIIPGDVANNFQYVGHVVEPPYVWHVYALIQPEVTK